MSERVQTPREMAEAWLAERGWPARDRAIPYLTALLEQAQRQARRDALEEAAKLTEGKAVKWQRSANETANAGEGDLGSIEAATCLDAQAAGAVVLAAAIRALDVGGQEESRR